MVEKAESAGASEDSEKFTAVIKPLPLPPGIFMFSVAANTRPSANAPGGLKLPSMHVALGPEVKSGQVELLAGAETHGNWLHRSGNVLIAKVNHPGATLILTSVRSEGGTPLSIKIERMDAASGNPAEAEEAQLKPIQEPRRDGLRLRINAHIRARGDLSFVDTPWAGRIESGLWMEAFSVVPLEELGADDIEYKGLTSSGFETPWLSNGASCGTRGMSVPLVGFAIRPKQGQAAAAAYDCEYTGIFRSGTMIGPLRNGTPCRSTQVNDPLEGIMVKILKRSATPAPAANTAAKAEPAKKPAPPAPRTIGPSFSKMREEAAKAKRGTERPGSRLKVVPPSKGRKSRSK